MEVLHVRLLGYDTTTRMFLLSICGDMQAPGSAPKRREVGDFQALDRALPRGDKSVDNAPTVPGRLSLRRLKKLAQSSWQRGDVATGWRLELQKNVTACEQWLEEALASVEAAVRTRFVDDDAYAAHHRARAETQRTTQRARQLQQYFTSEALVQHVLTRLRAILSEIKFPSVNDDGVVWLEPSCGDGRMVQALVTAGAKYVIGYELDERVFSTACDKLHEASEATLRQGDFLATRPPPSVKSTTVMVLGNPPFGADGSTNGVGSGERDLVAKFVLHSAHGWQAQLVAFIVPSRCAKPAYVETLLGKLNDVERLINEEHATMWSLVSSEELEDCVFDFQESKRVKQPSALVVFALQSSGK